MKKVVLLALFIGIGLTHTYAVKKRVLFIGNSYTYVNDLPLMLKNVAASTNDTVEYDSYTVGGYTLKQHASDNQTINKIMIGNWDYVVLQEQSQRPAFPISQVQADVYPYAQKLDSLIRHYNACAQTVFYMTWGYKNGDAGNCPNYPPICTYQGMDSLLRERYTVMADSNEALIAPVGPVRRYIRAQYPAIELYDTDGSHPSLAGTYAAACSFYAVLFRKNPIHISFNSTLPATVAANIRTAAEAVAFDSLSTWFVGAYDPAAQFTYTVSGNTASFSNLSANAQQYLWIFDDGNTSALANPVHTYAASGSYTVKLIAKHCGQSDTSSMTINVGATSVTGVSHPELSLFPNPVQNLLTLQAASMQLKDISLVNCYGAILPVKIKSRSTNQIAIDFSEYPQGIYYLKINTGDQTEIKKILKY